MKYLYVVLTFLFLMLPLVVMGYLSTYNLSAPWVLPVAGGSVIIGIMGASYFSLKVEPC